MEIRPPDVSPKLDGAVAAMRLGPSVLRSRSSPATYEPHETALYTTGLAARLVTWRVARSPEADIQRFREPPDLQDAVMSRSVGPARRDAPILSLRGPVDAVAVSDLAQQLAATLAGGSNAVVIDLRLASVMSAQVRSELGAALRWAADGDGTGPPVSLTVITTQYRLAAALEQAGIDGLQITGE
jgi:anti-anti-sigma regulatory factor